MADGDSGTTSTVRAAKNQVSFRAANEQLEEKRDELGLGGRTPFLCECDDPDCTALIALSLEEYEHVRSRVNWFLIAGRHRTSEDQIAEERSDYVIVVKEGLAGRIARDEDPRS
jgi:hypothetical protein